MSAVVGVSLRGYLFGVSVVGSEGVGVLSCLLILSGRCCDLVGGMVSAVVGSDVVGVWCRGAADVLPDCRGISSGVSLRGLVGCPDVGGVAHDVGAVS